MGAFDDIIRDYGRSAALGMASVGRSGGAAPRAAAPVAQFFQRVGSDVRSYPPDPAAVIPPPAGGTPEFRANYWKAVQQLASGGITDEQRATYKPVINNLLNKLITPYGYEGHNPIDKLRDIIDSGQIGRPNLPSNREDAWRMYLGIPQQYGGIGVSPYQPSRSTEPDKVYYRFNDFWRTMGSGRTAMGSDLIGQYVPPDDPLALRLIRVMNGADEQQDIQKRPVDIWSGAMGHYSASEGKDERGPYFSYYDRWDLDKNPVEGQQGRFGKPFELYDRLYYNPDKSSVYWNGPPATATRLSSTGQTRDER